MRFDLQHFTQPSEQSIHLFRKSEQMQFIASAIKQAAVGVHIAELDGKEIQHAFQLARKLEQLYAFPIRAADGHKPRVRWDGIEDWLADLGWLTDDIINNSAKHFILFFIDPQPFFRDDPVEFAIFLDVMCDVIDEHLKVQNSFHLLLGPIDHNIERFINVLRSAKYLCSLCQNT